MSDQIKVVAINGSPHGVAGNTGQMIEMVSSHLSNEGIILEEITITDKRIESAQGALSAWRDPDAGAETTIERS
jgi:multimeric flavodoxin WrbA